MLFWMLRHHCLFWCLMWTLSVLDLFLHCFMQYLLSHGCWIIALMSWGTGVPIYLSVDHTLFLLVHIASDHSFTYKHIYTTLFIIQSYPWLFRDLTLYHIQLAYNSLHTFTPQLALIENFSAVVPAKHFWITDGLCLNRNYYFKKYMKGANAHFGRLLWWVAWNNIS